MKKIIVLVFTVIAIGGFQSIFAQTDVSTSNLEYTMSNEETIMLFGGFAIAVVAIFLFLARDSILRRKTSYDKEEFESKKDKTFEKYHSGWTDDYVDFTYERNTKDDEELTNDMIFIDTRILFNLSMAIIDYGMPVEKAQKILLREGRVKFNLKAYIKHFANKKR